MFLISLAYILDFAINEKYFYEAMGFYNHTNYTEKEKLNEDEELNPYLEVTITLKNDNFTIMSKYEEEYKKDHIDKKGKSIYKIKGKADSIHLLVFFFCGEDKNCTLFKKYIELFRWSEFGNIHLEYPGYKIDHLNDPPIYKDKAKTFDIDFHLEDIYQPVVYYFDWEVIKYKDQKSLFDTFTNRQTEYIFGHLKNDKPGTEIYLYGTEDFANNWNIKEKHFLPLIDIKFSNNHDEYLLYKRKKIEFLDVLANIGAILSTVRTIFVVFFSFYSKNFNNYKVVGKILDYPKEPIKKIELTTKFKDDISLNEKVVEDENMNKIKNSEPLINKPLNDNNFKHSDINKNDDSSFSLDKLSFIDFLYNNIYLNCCKKKRNQEVINMVNDIIYKYLSIDSLIYNQMKLENLFKDYKWNNSMLNDIQNNPMIIKLKNT